MRICEYCHTELPDDATFCGSCGYTRSAKMSSPSSQSPSLSATSEDFRTALMSSNLDIAEPPLPDRPTVLSAPGQKFAPITGPNPKSTYRTTSPSLAGRPIEEMPTIIGEQKPLEETDDEEEQRRRLGFFNRIAPLAAGGVAGAAAFEMQNMAGQAPMLQGVPDPGAASMLAGTPQGAMQQNFPPSSNVPNQYFAGNNYAQNAPPIEQQYTPQQYYSQEAPYAPSFPPSSPPYTPQPGAGNFTTTPPPFPAQPQPTGNSSGLPKGCALWGAILLVPVLVLVTVLSLSVTIFAPTIAINGTTSVSSGDTLHLHGHGFLANTAVTLTVDDALPVQLVAQSTPSQLVQQQPLIQNQTVLFAATSLALAATGTSTVKAGANGTFDAAIMVNNTWLPGSHQMHAQENFSPRGATLSFTILGQGETLPSASTIMPTPIPTPIPGKKPTPTPTMMNAPTPVPTTPGVVTPPPTPTPVPPPPPTPTPTINSQLTSLTPTTLSLGTLPQGSTQTLTGQTTLNATGNALVAWMASWNQQQAPWLQVSPSSGQISTPGSQQVALTASAGTLQPGTYSTTVSFSSPFNNQPLTLTVSFTVQATCIKGSPSQLTFTGTVGGTDPAPQNVNIINCGAAGPWSAKTVTKDLASWLSVTPASGTLATNASQTATVSATLANLATGTYSGMVTFTNGTNQFQVAVTFTVQAVVIQSPPAIQASKMAFNLLQDCTAIATAVNAYTCTLTLTSVNAQQALAWTAMAGGRLMIVTPASGTVAPGTPTTVTVAIARAVCPGTNDTVTFASPNNTFAPVTVTFSC